jgi:hypothetical protein
MSMTLVQAVGKVASTLPISSTVAGNALIVVMSGASGAPATLTMTSNAGDTLAYVTNSTDIADSQIDMQVWFIQHGKGGATSISVSPGGGNTTLWLFEVSGQNIAAAAAGATNGVNTPGFGSATTIPGPALNPGAASQVFYVATGTDNAGGQSINSPFTQVTVTGQLSAAGYLFSSGTVTPQFSRQFSSSNWQTSAAAFVDLGPQPCSVFAHLTNPSAPLTDPNATFIRFVLRGFTGSVPTVGTPAVMVETQKDFPVDATGLVSATLWSNPDITPAGTWWTIEFWNQGKATARFNVIVDCRSGALDLSNVTLPSKVIPGKSSGF